jgi:NADPH2:quinone reductase
LPFTASSSGETEHRSPVTERITHHLRLGGRGLVHTFAAQAVDGYDVVPDFLWGRPTELLLKVLVPDRIGQTKRTRLVRAGESAGAMLALPADGVRTSGLEIYGAAKGLDTGSVAGCYNQIAPWARDGRLIVGIERTPLSEVGTAWQRTDLKGRRLSSLPKSNR